MSVSISFLQVIQSAATGVDGRKTNRTLKHERSKRRVVFRGAME